MLKLENVYKDYGNGKGIKDVSFQIRKGEICALLGHNGCGKTTTFRILLGLLDKDQGHITYEGKPLNAKEYGMFGYMSEERSLLRGLTVEEHVRYLARLKKMKEVEIGFYLSYWLKFFKIEEYRNTKIIELSKGNQQKVQLVCALIHNPNIVIFDEPLNGLDVDNVFIFKKLLKKLKEEGKIVFISSHQFQNIEHFCDYVVYLKEGEVVMQGNILALKKQQKQRWMTIHSKDLSFVKKEGVLSYIQENEYLVLKIQTKEVGYSLMKELIEKEIDEFKMELLPLSEIMKEKIE